MAWNFQVRKDISHFMDCAYRKLTLFPKETQVPLVQIIWYGLQLEVFKGSIFTEVAEICYTKLNLLLLAMEARKYEGGDIFINPKNKVINPNAIGEPVFNTIFR